MSLFQNEILVVILLCIGLFGDILTARYVNNNQRQTIIKTKDHLWSASASASKIRHLRQKTQPCIGGCKRDALLNKNSDNEIKMLRIEMIKKEILDKLGLDERPNVTMDRDSIPQLIKKQIERMGINGIMQGDQPRQDVEEEKAKTTKIIIFGDGKPCSYSSIWPSSCLHFKIKKDSVNVEIKSAKLWFYKKQDGMDAFINHTMVITDITRNRKHRKNHQGRVLAAETTGVKEGWVEVDIRHAVHKWFSPSLKQLDKEIRIGCRTCKNNNPVPEVGNRKRPFIVINMGAGRKKNRRSRRNVIDCSKSVTTCCRQPLSIKFSDIGWDDWIINPEGYTVNYCKGSCSAPTVRKFIHTSFLWAEGFIPCCNPERMSQMSLIYLRSDGQIIFKTLPNMVVESCKCS